MDENTKLQRRIDYARVCVILSADSEILTTVLVNVGRETEFKVEYEWLPEVCSKCKVFGQATISCQKRVTRNWVPRDKNPLQSVSQEASESGKLVKIITLRM